MIIRLSRKRKLFYRNTVVIPKIVGDELVWKGAMVRWKQFTQQIVHHSNLPGWRTNMDPSPDTWTRTQRGFGPVLYQQLWCSSSSHCEQENWWRQTHYLAYALCLIKKWRWPIKIVLAYTFFKTWCRYQENRAETNASITATKERWYLLKSAQHSPIQPKQEYWHINRERPILIL